jgi:hypothetical protein
LAEISTFVKNCESYGRNDDDSLVCKKCISGKVISDDGLKCFDNLVGCQIAESADRCQVCLPSMALVNGQCQSANIPNCKLLNNEDSSQTAKCKQCDEDYYITNEYQCSRGVVPNCAVFQKFLPTKCEKCKEGYSIFTNFRADYCFKIQESLNCGEADIQSNSIFGAEISCTTCKEPNFIVTENPEDISSSSLCMEFTPIPNCVEYDKKDTLEQSTFACV